MPGPHLEALLHERQWLVSLSRHLVLGAGEAEDIAQETLLQAIRLEDELPPEHARSWLAATARNIAFRKTRSSGNRVAREREVAKPELASDKSPDEMLEVAEFRSQVAQAVMGLQEPERTAIVMRYYEGLTPTEIAERTGSNPAAVRQRLSRAVGRLRSQLDDKGEPRAWLPAAVAVAGGRALAGKGAVWLSPAVLVPLAIAAATVVALLLPKKQEQEASALESDVALAAPTETNRDITATKLEPPGAEHGTRVDAAPAVAESNASEPGAAESAREVDHMTVQIVDDETGAPVADVPWFVIATGSEDRGRLEGFGPEEPNPKPLAQGITDPDGRASFPVPDRKMVHLGTIRIEEHARGSWPLIVEDFTGPPGDESSHDADQSPTVLRLGHGRAVIGRVVDDEGTPLEGVLIIGRDFYDKYEVRATTDLAGGFTFDKAASFPRAYVLNGEGLPAPGRSDGMRIWAVPADLWSETMRDPWAGSWAGVGFKPGTQAIQQADIKLPRPTIQLGKVLNPHGKPLAGLLVTTRLDRLAQARGREPINPTPPLPWQPNGRLTHEEAITDAHGQFELEIRGYDRELCVVTPAGETKSHPLGRLVPGAFLDPVTMTINDLPPYQVQLEDPVTPDRAIPWTPSSERKFTIVFDAPPGELYGDDVQVHIEDTGNGKVTQRMLDGRFTAGTVLLDGYAAARVNFGATRRHIKVPMQRLPAVSLRLTGLDVAPSKGAIVSISPRPAVIDRRGQVLDTPFIGGVFSRHSQITRDVPLNTPTQVSWTRTDRAWIYVRTFHPSDTSQGSASARDVIRTVAFGPFEAPPAELSLDLSRPDLAATATDETAPHGPLADTRPATVQLRVVSLADGSPIEGARISSLTRTSGGYINGSSDDGGLIHARANAGTIEARIDAPGYGPLALEPFTLTPSEEADIGEFALEPLRTTRGQLVRQDGLQVSKRHRITFKDEQLGNQYVSAEKDGSFTLAFAGAPPDVIRVHAQTGGHAAYVTLPLTAGQDPSGRPTPTYSLPPWRQLQVAVRGLDLATSLLNGSITAEGTGGQKVRLLASGRQGDWTLFSGLLPAGEWTIKSGPVIQVPTQRIELPAVFTDELVKVETAGSTVR